MMDIDPLVLIVFATFAVYGALLLMERMDPQASRRPL
jgi:hypothetical protein